MTIKSRIERRTGVLWGIERTTSEPAKSALFYMRLGGRRTRDEWVDFEVGALGRFFYLTIWRGDR